jgi:AhpD family alkylhydroperoxidase
MARISAVPEQDLPDEVRLALQQARSGLVQMTGRELERGIEPLELYAHSPALFAAVRGFAAAGGQLTSLDKRTRALAQLKAATMTHCEFCIDVGSLISHYWGLTDEELLALANYRTSPLFSEVDKLVLDYAVGISRTPVEVPDAVFDQLKQHFSDTQLVELTHIIAGENMAGRFNVALGVGAAGFSEGMVCAVPATMS